jgi:hypothetical protein
MAVTWRQFAFAYKVASKTTAAWSKTIGATGDYATWAAMIADMPDLIAHAVTVTIQAGTTLTETCELKNKHGITKDGAITIQAEKYFPTSGVIPTADLATATTLRDAVLTAAALGNDYFNGCWIFILAGTGKDNGFVPITDYVDATGDVVVASWPGTQPDNTSRYLIVGALFDGEGSARDTMLESWVNSCPLVFNGLGFTDGDKRGVTFYRNTNITFSYCCIDKCDNAGVYIDSCLKSYVEYCGLVDNNTDNPSTHGGIVFDGGKGIVTLCGISNNGKYGVLALGGAFSQLINNFGDGNTSWGSYAMLSGQIDVAGIECSGVSGNHSDVGTAGNNSADQAAIY